MIYYTIMGCKQFERKYAPHMRKGGGALWMCMRALLFSGQRGSGAHPYSGNIRGLQIGLIILIV